jgi:hypothetical protein
MKRLLIDVLIILTMGFIPYSVYADGFTYTTISYPDASSTYANGIDGNNIVGFYSDASGTCHGFLYNGSTYTTIDYPATGHTVLNGIDGDNIVGSYKPDNTGSSHGFIYNASTFTLLDVPGFKSTQALGIDGSNIVGYCYDDINIGIHHGFIYDGSTYKTFVINPNGHTLAYGIDGNNIVGHYQDGSGYHGFIYNGLTSITLDFPGAEFTSAHGIYGNNIVGEWDEENGNTHGFLYNGSTYISLDFPGSGFTEANGIDGNNIVGVYHDGQTYRGFLATDTTPPSVTAFSIPKTSTSSTVSIAIFTASDNVGVTGYMVTNSFSAPSADSSEWSVTPPVSFTFPSTVKPGKNTLYAWAKDAAGNISQPFSAMVTLRDITKPIVTAFSISSPSTSTTVSITAFSATDNFEVTGYVVTRSFFPPFPNSSKWSVTPPVSFTFPSTVRSGTKILYAWAKDAAGHVSRPFSAKVTINLPSTPR